MSRVGGTSFDLEAVEVRRGDRTVLHVPRFSIAEGESLAILGPNGAGKSTLLSVLAGLEAPSSGIALSSGRPAHALEARRAIALVPQDAPMLRGTVLANVELPLRFRGISRSLRRERALHALERLGVAQLAKRPAHALSGGETRRVAIARALVSDPGALLLDEPFSGIDGPARDALLIDLRAAVRESGRTLVIVTQVRDEALRLGGRLAILWRGELRQTGTPQEVFARPADADLARFLGIENVLRGVWAPDNSIDLGGRRLLSAIEAPFPAPGAAVWVVFGPEHVELRLPAATGTASPRNVLPATVRELEPREGRIHVHLDAGIPLIAAVTRAAVDSLALAPGSRVEAVIKATALHVVSAG